MDSETQEIIDHFLNESRESIAEVEPLLMELEAEGGTPDRATIDTIFRLFHSMKGSASFLEFKNVEGVTHHAETLLDRVRDEEMQLDENVVDVLCRALDFTNDALDCIESSHSDAALAEVAAGIIVRMEECSIDASEPEDAREVPAEDGGLDLFGFAPPPPEEPVEASGEAISGMTVFFDDKPGVSAPVDEEETAPVLEAVDARLGQLLLQLGKLEPEQLTDALANPAGPLGETLVQNQLVSEDVVRKTLDVQTSVRTAVAAAKATSGINVEAAARKTQRRAEYLRVDVRKLDALMDLIGELIIAETAVTLDPSNTAGINGKSKAAVQLNRITRGLQDVAMSLRMVPISPTFKKMKRLVRDLSKRQDKHVRLEISGEDTEVDKSVVEAISDPLVHLIRNSIDHGIEDESGRVAAGKPVEGTVTLSARQQAGEIRITVRDDGRGLSRDKILTKARARGLVKDDGSGLTENEVYRLLFEAGFSTAEEVSDISGRGVGMDVVRQNIEAVKGRVEIASTLGVGTTITLRIPLTLAIIEGMLVRVGNTRFTIPMLSIVETVVARRNDLTRLTNGQEVVRVRGAMLPVFRVHKFYEIESGSTRIEDGLLVVVEDGSDRLCLLVDELVGQRQTVIKPLSGYLGNVRGLAGCTVLGDGAISLIIDVAKLVQDTRSSSAA